MKLSLQLLDHVPNVYETLYTERLVFSVSYVQHIRSLFTGGHRGHTGPLLPRKQTQELRNKILQLNQ